MDLNSDLLARYRRHFVLPGMGTEGQKKLIAAKVLLAGAGGLGSPVAIYLASAGVGTIGIADPESVELSNLQRQILYGQDDIGKMKVDCAGKHLRALNPAVEIICYPIRLDSENTLGIIKDYDIVVDGSDNLPARYLLSDACVLAGKPDVYGAVYRYEGQATVFSGGNGPCYRCLYPEPPPPEKIPNCEDGGVLGVLPGLIGLVQATEVIKLITGIGKPLIGRLLAYDALKLSFRELRFRKDPDCPVCGRRPSVKKLIDYEGFCSATVAGKTAGAVNEVSIEELEKKRLKGEDFLLLDVREVSEHQIANIQGSRCIPLADLDKRWQELSDFKNREIIVYCRLGRRGRRAAEILSKRGFGRVKNLTGGIDAWAAKVDPKMRRDS